METVSTLRGGKVNDKDGDEITENRRFDFGTNWQAFLKTLNEEQIEEAVISLRRLLGVDTLDGKRFLDIGSGSGLASLAARRLGAYVHSFDYDPKSVSCTREIRERFSPDDKNWCVEQGSVLDHEYLQSLGRFDFTYSWGVLHHTGDLVTGLQNAVLPVSDRGVLCLAIYNDQDFASIFWKNVKKAYCKNRLTRACVIALFLPLFMLQAIVIGLVKYRNPVGYFIHYKKRRGMSVYHDWIDWLGGYPFEVAKPEVIIHFYREKGFALEELITTNRLGCNQFVFRKVV